MLFLAGKLYFLLCSYSFYFLPRFASTRDCGRKAGQASSIQSVFFSDSYLTAWVCPLQACLQTQISRDHESSVWQNPSEVSRPLQAPLALFWETGAGCEREAMCSPFSKWNGHRPDPLPSQPPAHSWWSEDYVFIHQKTSAVEHRLLQTLLSSLWEDGLPISSWPWESLEASCKLLYSPFCFTESLLPEAFALKTTL